jgi:integrating conjugative element protein (TIGR03761 family)
MDASATAKPAADSDIAPSSEEPIPASASEPGSPGNQPDPERGLGRLADAAPDTMSLHTREAYRLFLGQKADPERGLVAIVGARRFAAVLKSLWHLSANDNPYADWILIQTYAALTALRNQLANLSRSREEAIEALRRKGLSLSVMASRVPMAVELGFRSPYGYATAEVIVEFDYYVRIVKTLIHKDRLSDDEGRAAIRTIGRPLRALFLTPIRWERALLSEALRPLTRSDFLPGADEAAGKRVKAAVAVFGEVPRAVFTGAEAPRHSRRRVRLSDAELKLLEQASLGADSNAAPNEGALL